MWDLLWTRRHWDGFSAGYFSYTFSALPHHCTILIYLLASPTVYELSNRHLHTIAYSKRKNLIFRCLNTILVPDSLYEVLMVPTGFRIQICSDPTISTGLKGEKMAVERIFIPKTMWGSHFVA
jgi:hypothetical protein